MQSWRKGSQLQTVHVTDNLDLMREITKITNDLEEKCDGKVGHVLFIALPAGKDVDPHFDSGDYLDVTQRHHVPIFTNDHVRFVVDKEEQYMAVGDCWEINNNKEHAVKNLGDTDRVHLLIDVIPNKYLGDIK
jgi:aspartyl/asparaginyl beta-hydroxylase (cupin superfamily)